MGKEKTAGVTAQHQPQKKFIPGKDIELEIVFKKKPDAVVLHYRRVNHGERYMSVRMKAESNNKYVALIPASYTNSVYPLAYYFEVKETPKVAALYAGLGAQLKEQPYFIIRQA